MKSLALLTTVAALAIAPAMAQTQNPSSPSGTPPAAQPSSPPSGQTTTPPTGSPPSAQTTPSTAPKAGMADTKFVQAQQSGQWMASDLIGTNVKGPGDENIGSIDDLVVDASGNIVAAVIGVGGFLGLGQKNVAVSFDSLKLSRDANGNEQASLSMTKDELKNAPEFKTQDQAQADMKRQQNQSQPSRPSPTTPPKAN